MSSTQTSERAFTTITQAIALLFSGAAIGWFIGISLSPVLHILVTSILTAAVTAVTAMAGLDGLAADSKATATGQESVATSSGPQAPSALVAPHRHISRRLITLVPLTVLLFGMVCGASFGTYARSHDWFGADPQSLIRKWRVTKLSDDEIAKRLFDQLYPPNTRSTGTEASDSKSGEQGGKGSQSNHPDALTGRLTGGLFSGVPPEECKEFRSAPNNDLQRFMLGSKNEGVRNFTKRCNDVACLRAAVEELLCTEQRP
jgi:hypothetical protein